MWLHLCGRLAGLSQPGQTLLRSWPRPGASLPLKEELSLLNPTQAPGPPDGRSPDTTPPLPTEGISCFEITNKWKM